MRIGSENEIVGGGAIPRSVMTATGAIALLMVGLVVGASAQKVWSGGETVPEIQRLVVQEAAVSLIVSEAPALQRRSITAVPLDMATPTEPVLVVVPEATPILKNGRVVSLSHLHPGQRILCRGVWTGEGRTVFRAARVSIAKLSSTLTHAADVADGAKTAPHP